MTIPSTARKAGPLLGTGVQTAWPFTFKVFAAADVAVTIANSLGVETALVLDTDYSVTLNANQETSPGGTVTYPISGTPLAVGSVLSIIGDLDYDQPLDLPSGGNFSPLALENQLDRTIMQVQQLREVTDRALLVPVTSDADGTLPVPEAQKILGWDINGTGLQNYDIPDLFSGAVYADWIAQTFTGTGSQTLFVLQRAPGAVGNCDVSVDGQTYVPNVDFSLSGATLTFTAAPILGAEILVRYGSAATQVASTFSTETQTATAGQTVFTLANLIYNPGANALAVYVNGLRMVSGVDLLETDTNEVTFTSGLSLADEVLFIAGRTINETIGAEAVSYLPAGAGAVATTVQTKLRETVSVKDFGAVGDGVTDDTAAIQAAAQSLTGNQTLHFPDGTYLISYIWTPYSDSDPVNGIGRGRGVCAFVNKPNIRLYGPRATIKCVNHDIATYGGFTFAWVTKSPGFTIEGFNFDMTFTGYNTSGSYYPMCGGLMSYDKYAGAGTQTTLNSNLTARDLTFKLYHPNGAFGITSSPYGSDDNNGFKIISVFASGDSAATAYSEQSRNLFVQNIKFLKGHNGYGCWGVAYNEATFKDIFADAWVAASYTIATATYTGTNFVAPVRFYQYACNGLTVDNVQVLSLPWAERTGAFQGRCGGVSVDCGLTDRFSGGGSITNCTFVLDDDNSTLGAQFDVGVKSSLSGHIRIADNSFHAWSSRGAVCIFAEGADGTGTADYTIAGNIVSKNLCGPFIQIFNSNNTSDANRIIKSVTITGNIVKGWGGEGAVYGYRTGTTYYGVEHAVVSNNVFDGTASASASLGTAVDVRGRTSSDNIIVTQNVIDGAATPVQLGSSNKIITDNVYLNNVGNGTFGNYLTNTYGTLATFSAAQAVAMTIPTGYYNEYQYTEYSGTGAIVTMLAGLASSTTGTIRTVGAGNTGKLFYKQIANIK